MQTADQLSRIRNLYKDQTSTQTKYLNWGFPFLDKALYGLTHGLFIITAPANLGKCLAEGSLISTEDGSLVPIEQINNHNVLSLDVNTLKMVSNKALQPICNGKKPCYKMITSLGHEITGTDNHPFYTLDGWKELKDLQVDDKIAVAGNLPFFGENPITNEECIVLGLMTGDGYCADIPTFTTADSGLINKLESCMISLYGHIEVRKETKKNNKASSYSFPKRLASRIHKIKIYKLVAKETGLAEYRVTKLLNHPDQYKDTEEYKLILETAESYGYVENIYNWSASPMVSLLKKHNLYDKNSSNKFVPPAIFNAPKEQVAAYISALYACDGSAYTIANKGYGGITYTSKSEQLIRDLQQLLLRFSIATKIRHRNIKYGEVMCTAWQLDFSGRNNALRFAKEIGILSKERQLAEFIDLPITQLSKNSLVNHIPKELSSYICSIAGNAVLPDKISTIRTSARRGTRAFHRELISEIGQYFNDGYLLKLGNSDVVWDKIVSIESVGIKKVYDIEVPATHNFIANNFVVHNSACVLNIYKQLINCNDDVFVIDFTLDDSFEDRVTNSIAGMAKVPINWVKFQNGPDVTDQARAEILNQYKIWNSTCFSDKLDMRDETDFNNRGRFFNNIKKHILDVRKQYPDRKLVVIIDGFHNIVVDNPAYAADEYAKQQWLSAEMKTLSAESNAIIIATAHTPKKNMRRGLDQDAVKGGGGITYDAKVISTIFSDYKINRANAAVFFQATLPHSPGTLVTLPVIELDIVKNKTSSFCDILFYRFYPEYAFMEECDEKYQVYYKSLVYGKQP